MLKRVTSGTHPLALRFARHDRPPGGLPRDGGTVQPCWLHVGVRVWCRISECRRLLRAVRAESQHKRPGNETKSAISDVQPCWLHTGVRIRCRVSERRRLLQAVTWKHLIMRSAPLASFWGVLPMLRWQ